ncbi:MAG: aconitase X catalytic domain-containing protein, partial [Candidatus Aenigmarchaeota archaeon]|nr:aconitase X catalytic domain-containing protein [Candidatus Aenigmarchaeota archaeon]
GKHGRAAQKSMEILVALGEIYGAKKLVPVKSVQVAGVSYHNLGDAGLEYLEELARDGNVRVKTTINPAGMDLRDWKKLGISSGFAEKQLKVIDAFKKLGIDATATCTPYLVGNRPGFGEHIAWSESSAVCFANSVLGAKTNREGGPSALAAAIVGKTPMYGMHLDENRQAQVTVLVRANIEGLDGFSALGYAIGKKIGNKIPYIIGIKASADQLKIFSASIATYGGTALFHVEGVTPNKIKVPVEKVEITEQDVQSAKDALNDECDVDFVALGCPHASIEELREISELLEGRKVVMATWISTARKIKDEAEKLGFIKTIEDAGAIVAADTCMAVAPLKGRFKCMATNSAKA